MEIKEMSIDLETYSDRDIQKCGVYKYAESDLGMIRLTLYFGAPPLMLFGSHTFA